MSTVFITLPDEKAGARLDRPAGAGPLDDGARAPRPAPGRFARVGVAVGGAALWLASILFVSALMARLQLGYWPDASFCALVLGPGMRVCAGGHGALFRLAGFLLDQVDAALVIGCGGAALLLAGTRARG